MHYGSGSVVPSRSAGFTNTGSPRPARPGQLDQMMADNIAGGADPAEINEMCHASAAALLDRVHHTQDAELVERVLTPARRTRLHGASCSTMRRASACTACRCASASVAGSALAAGASTSAS